LILMRTRDPGHRGRRRPAVERGAACPTIGGRWSVNTPARRRRDHRRPPNLTPRVSPKNWGTTRCGARTRAGPPCRASAVKGKRRCRMRGGAAGSSGAPHGPRNGAYRDGNYTNEAKLLRKLIAEVLKSKRPWPSHFAHDLQVIELPDQVGKDDGSVAAHAESRIPDLNTSRTSRKGHDDHPSGAQKAANSEPYHGPVAKENNCGEANKPDYDDCRRSGSMKVDHQVLKWVHGSYSHPQVHLAPIPSQLTTIALALCRMGLAFLCAGKVGGIRT
jgi:hypothetical protein